MTYGTDRDRNFERAEAALAEYFARLESGEALVFESWADERAEIAQELRELYAVCGLMRQSAPAPSPALEALGNSPNRFGDYEIESTPLAQGGMGTILSVRDRTLRRDLAMKVLRRGGAVRDEARRIARFLTEARITSQLGHPGIVPVHELGVDRNRRPYFTMKRVQGRTLEVVFERVAAGDAQWTQARALGVLQRVCEALSFAHSKGVIHRDLKPANVMVGEFGDVYVMDWGLARVLGEPDLGEDERAGATAEGLAGAPATATRDGEVLGTPVYMAPEQAAGRQAEVGRHSDVYAVGAMLYQLLAARPPYDAPDGHKPSREVLRDLLAGPPERLRALAPDAPAELVAITERAMERDWRKRYPDMSALSAELTAYLEGRVVQAHATGAWAEARKWVARNRALAAALLAAVLILLAGTLTSLVYAGRANARELDSRASERRATKIRDVLVQALDSGNPERGGAAGRRVQDVLVDLARELDGGALREDPTSEAYLQTTLARMLGNAGQPADALRLAQASLTTLLALSSRPRTDLLEAYSTLGNCQMAMGQGPDALGAFQSALDVARALAPGDDPQVVRALLHVSDVRMALRDFAAGIESAEEALAMSRRLRPADPRAIASALGNLAGGYRSVGRPDEALALLQESLGMLERLEPGDALEKAEAELRLGSGFEELDRQQEALPHYEAALAMQRHIYGGGSIELCASLHRVGHCLMELERYDEALPRNREALALARSTQSDELTFANYTRELAVNQNRLEHDVEALSLHLEAVGICERLRPTDEESEPRWQQEYARCVRDLAAGYVYLGRAEDARPYAEQAVELCARAFGSDSAQYKNALLVLQGVRDELERKANRAHPPTEKH